MLENKFGYIIQLMDIRYSQNLTVHFFGFITSNSKGNSISNLSRIQMMHYGGWFCYMNLNNLSNIHQLKYMADLGVETIIYIISV